MADRPVETDSISTVLALDKKPTSPVAVTRPKVLVAGAAVIVLLILWLTLGNGKGSNVQYLTQPVSKGTLLVRVTATGNLEPTNQVDVGSEVSGRAAAVFVDFNDHVKKGQILAVMDTTTLKAQVLAAQAALEAANAKVLEAEATVAEASSELVRREEVHKLSAGRVPSQSELDTARAAVKRARATLASARANVAQSQATMEQNQSTLDKATILSPVDGIVLSRAIDPGQTVAASFQAPVLFTLAEDLSKMELHVDVDEADVGKVKDGQSATFAVDAYPGRSFPAQVLQVRYGSQEVDGVITYETTLSVDNADLLLRPGMTATADIIVREAKDALLVPTAALRFSPPTTAQPRQSANLLSRIMPRPPRQQSSAKAGADGQRSLWILAKGAPKEVKVTTGASNGATTEILSGDLQPGMEVITDSINVAKP